MRGHRRAPKGGARRPERSPDERTRPPAGACAIERRNPCTGQETTNGDLAGRSSDPPAHIFGGGLRGSSAPISTDGPFRHRFAYQGAFSDGTPYNGHFNLTGHFSGATATGTLTATLNFTASGTPYSCGSGQQTWTASRTG